jgi:hypothetical protein
MRLALLIDPTVLGTYPPFHQRMESNTFSQGMCSFSILNNGHVLKQILNIVLDSFIGRAMMSD